MVQRTLTALFSLAVLILPASQLYADSDATSSVYSGLECQYQENRWSPTNKMEIPSYADMNDVVYHSRLGIGNTAPDTRMPAGDYEMIVSCPLPSLMYGDEVVVAVIDGTVHADVACRVQSCVAGIGDGTSSVEGQCMDGSLEATVPKNDPAYTSEPGKYITQNVDWLNPMAPNMQTSNGGARRVPYTMPDLGEVYSHLICTLPEQDTLSPQAPGLPSQMRGEQGVSYIQSYYVN